MARLIRSHTKIRNETDLHAIDGLPQTDTTCTTTQVVSSGLLLELRTEFETSTSLRIPVGFNYVHFLLLLLYDTCSIRDENFPLTRTYYRLRRKLITSKRIIINDDTLEHRQEILECIYKILNKNEQYLNEYVEETKLSIRQCPINCLFRLYSPLHIYFNMEPLENNEEKVGVICAGELFDLFRSHFMKQYTLERCDYLHYCIAHGKTRLIQAFFDQDTTDTWLTSKINSASDRHWLPLHYACYVGDRDIVEKLCHYKQNINPFHLLIPKARNRDFNEHPFDYLLRATGMGRETDVSSIRIPSIAIDNETKTQGDVDDEGEETDEELDELPTTATTETMGRERRDSFDYGTSPLTQAYDVEIPDADELEYSAVPQLSREKFLRKIAEQPKGIIYVVPSPLLLAAACVIQERTVAYDDIVKILLQSNLIDYDGINHVSLTKNVCDYFSKSKYVNFNQATIYRDLDCKDVAETIYYKCDALFTTTTKIRLPRDGRNIKDNDISNNLIPPSKTVNNYSTPIEATTTTQNDSRLLLTAPSSEDGTVTTISEDGSLTNADITAQIYCFITVLLQRNIFMHFPNWDHHLLKNVLQLYSEQIQKIFHCYPKALATQGQIIHSEKLNELTWKLIVSYEMMATSDHSEPSGKTFSYQLFQVSVEYYFILSYADLLADTYFTIYHTPLSIVVQNECLTMLDTLLHCFFTRRGFSRWGTLSIYELETCFDLLFQSKKNFQTFSLLCSIVKRYYQQTTTDSFSDGNTSMIQRIFVYAFASCVKRNARMELDYLIRNFSLIYYDSCLHYPSDIRHNVLSYCVVRNQASILEQLMLNIKQSMYKIEQQKQNSTWNPSKAWSLATTLYSLTLQPTNIDTEQQQQQSTSLISTILHLNQELQNGENSSNGGASSNNQNSTSPLSYAMNLVYTCTGDEYRQCRRVRNTAISKRKQRGNEKRQPIILQNDFEFRPSRSETTTPTHQHHKPGGRLLKNLKQLQFKLTHPNQHYVQQINNSDLFTQNQQSVNKNSDVLLRLQNRSRGGQSNETFQSSVDEKDTFVQSPVSRSIPDISSIRAVVRNSETYALIGDCDETNTTTVEQQNLLQLESENSNKHIADRGCRALITTPLVPQLTYIPVQSELDQNQIGYGVGKGGEDEDDTVRGQTLLHVAARLQGHEDIVRVLIADSPIGNSIMNLKGQIPLLCAIEAGSTSTAQLLLEADPQSLTAIDDKKSSVFHYACHNKNDVILASAIALLRRLSSSQAVRVQALRNLVEKNSVHETPFSIACSNGSIKCIKQFISSKWLHRRIPLSDLITADAMKTCIDNDQLEIVTYLVSDLKRFRVILDLVIDTIFTESMQQNQDVIVGRRLYNLLEYSILLKKGDFVKIFVSVVVPRRSMLHPKVQQQHPYLLVRNSSITNIHQQQLNRGGLQGDLDGIGPNTLHDEYKKFLTRYSLPFINEQCDQTPIQRMLKSKKLLPYVPSLLEQFIDENGLDLSVIDDCLCSKPTDEHCIYGRNSLTSQTSSQRFSTAHWLKEHPLNLISEFDYPPIYDHPIVKTAVDTKIQLFGNLLYAFILLLQVIYVVLYTGVALTTSTPIAYDSTYNNFENSTCLDMCEMLTNKTFNGGHTKRTQTLIIFRFLLLIFSCAALIKEFIQVLTQRGRYFRTIFINSLEIQTYTCAAIFAMNTNDCTKLTGIRCKYQWDLGAIGIATVWTTLLLVFVNSLKMGKYGLLFINVFLTFLKFCLIYIFIWIGYLLAFHMLLTHVASFQSIFLAIPKMVAMLTGEYDFDDLFFINGEHVKGTTAAMVLFALFVFTMNICVMNILIGLAVSDVNKFQLNAKHENLRSRIKTILSFQAKFGLICQIFSRMVFAITRSFKGSLNRFAMRFPHVLGLKYDLSKLDIRVKQIQVPRSQQPGRIAQQQKVINCKVGYVSKKNDLTQTSLFIEDPQEKILRKSEEVKEELERTQLRISQELHRLTLTFAADFDELKRKLIEK